MEVTLWALAAASTITVVQRIWVVRRQALSQPAPLSRSTVSSPRLGVALAHPRRRVGLQRRPGRGVPRGQLAGQGPGGLAGGAEGDVLAGLGTTTGRPSTIGAIAWTAVDRAPPPTSRTRRTVDAGRLDRVDARRRARRAAPRRRPGRGAPASRSPG